MSTADQSHFDLFGEFPDPIVVADESRAVVYVNAAFQRKSGYDAQEVLGGDIAAFLSIRPSDDSFELGADLLIPVSFQAHIKRKDHSVFIAEVEAGFIRGGDDRIAGTYHLIRDISPQVRMERLFLAIEERTRAGTQPMDAWISDILELGCDYFGMRLGILRRPCADGGHAVYLNKSAMLRSDPSIQFAAQICAHHPASAGNLSADAVWSDGTHDGATRDPGPGSWLVSHVGTPLDLGDNQPGTLIFCSSIPRARAFDAAERLAIRTLRQLIGGQVAHLIGNAKSERKHTGVASSEALYKGMLRSVPAKLMFLDLEGRILDVTERMLNRFGFDRADVIGHKPAEFMDEASRARPESDPTATIGHPGNYVNEPFVFLDKTGKAIDIEISATLHDEGLIMASLVDVSERNLARLELEQRNAELEALNDSLQNFASIASHDMQEPLRKIRYFSEMLQHAIAEGEQKDADLALDVLGRAARRASTLVGDLLAFSRSSNATLARERVDLASLVKDLVEEVQRDDAGRDAAFEFDMPRIVVAGDRTAIYQLFRNLIANALKYRHAERIPKVRIEGAVNADRSASLRICDNGIGFDQEFAETIMKPFRRLHRRADYPGSGIGLAICDTVARRHGWRLHADACTDIGATFTLDIPADEMLSQFAPERPAPGGQSGQSVSAISLGNQSFRPVGAGSLDDRSGAASTNDVSARPLKPPSIT